MCVARRSSPLACCSCLAVARSSPLACCSCLAVARSSPLACCSCLAVARSSLPALQVFLVELSSLCPEQAFPSVLPAGRAAPAVRTPEQRLLGSKTELLC